MTTTQQTDGTSAGRQMVAELKAVHGPLRRDVVQLERALDILDDATADVTAIPEMIEGLTVAKFVWQLRVNCEYYCNTVDLHHTIEDKRMFPVLLRQFPELKPVISRLKSEHEDVVGLVNEARSASWALTTEHASVERARETITKLAQHLQAHLDYEEASIFPYFLKMSSNWHYG